MKLSLVFIIPLFFFNNLSAQDLIITGTITNQATGESVSRAIITISKGQRIILTSLSDTKGRYLLHFRQRPDTGTYLLKAALASYTPNLFSLNITDSSLKLIANLQLTPDGKMLSEVILKSKIPAVVEKGDTIEYNASNYANKETRKVEDLIKNIDGFKISQDGSITYRGKLLKAMLINGDDLARKEYQLISKNLTAEIIDKIQVIDNYNENRILRNIQPSGEVAVNLKIKKKLEGRVSGSATIGAGLLNKYYGDVSLLQLKKTKILQLFNLNNISAPSIYKSNIVITTEQNNIEFTTYPLYQASDVLQSSLPKEYVLNADLIGLHSLIAGKISPKTKYSGLFSFAAEKSLNKEQSVATVFLDATHEWQLNNYQSANRTYLWPMINLNFQHDNQKKTVSQLDLKFKPQIEHINYTDLASIAVNDSLSEKNRIWNIPFNILYTSTTAVANKTVLNILASATYSSSNYNTTIASNRFRSFFGLPADEIIRQLIKDNTFSSSAEVALIKNEKKTTYKAGSNITFNRSNISQFLTTLNTPVAEKITEDRRKILQMLKSYTFLSVMHRFTPTLNANAKVAVGAGYNNLNGTGPTTLLWKSHLDIAYIFHKKTQLSFQLISEKKLPPLYYNFFDSTIQHFTSFYLSSNTKNAIKRTEINFSVSEFLPRSNSSLITNLWYHFSPLEYNVASFYSPEISQYEYKAQKNYTEAGFLIAGKTFFYPIRTTLSLSYLFNRNAFANQINNEDVSQKMISQSLTLGYISSFKFPINFDINFTKNFYKAMQLGIHFSQAVRNNTTDLKIKSRIQFGKLFYVGIQYNYLKVSSTGFDYGDLFSTYTISKKVSIDLKLHNVFNEHFFIIRNVLLNTEAIQKFEIIPRYCIIKLNISI